MKNLQRLLIATVFLSALAAVGCTVSPTVAPSPSPSAVGRAPSPAPPRVRESGRSFASPPKLIRGHGVVKSIDPDRHGIFIEHEANAALRVPAGVSHYRVDDDKVFADVQPGDEVDYDVEARSQGEPVVADIIQMGR
jgi:Cu/Ag efflux protein CusF